MTGRSTFVMITLDALPAGNLPRPPSLEDARRHRPHADYFDKGAIRGLPSASVLVSQTANRSEGRVMRGDRFNAWFVTTDFRGPLTGRPEWILEERTPQEYLLLYPDWHARAGEYVTRSDFEWPTKCAWYWPDRRDDWRVILDGDDTRYAIIGFRFMQSPNCCRLTIATEDALPDVRQVGETEE